jgi:hypothetical protein
VSASADGSKKTGSSVEYSERGLCGDLSPGEEGRKFWLLSISKRILCPARGTELESHITVQRNNDRVEVAEFRRKTCTFPQSIFPILLFT